MQLRQSKPTPVRLQMRKDLHKEYIESLQHDLRETAHWFDTFKTKEAKQALNKLRFLLILTLHSMEPKGD